MIEWRRIGRFKDKLEIQWELWTGIYNVVEGLSGEKLKRGLHLTPQGQKFLDHRENKTVYS